MAQSVTAADGGTETENFDVDEVAETLQANMSAEELRRFAAQSAASRPRGATKAETAKVVAEEDPEMAKMAAEGGDFSVTCTCGLNVSFGHPQVARRVAKSHKADNLTHFPTAKDDRDDCHLYG